MNRCLHCLYLLLCLVGSVVGQDKPFPAETELRTQARRRELLHQQLKLLLASPDPDVLRLGVVFHALGQYDPKELVPLLSGTRGVAHLALLGLWQYPELPEPVQDALIELEGQDLGLTREGIIDLLTAKVPGWREPLDAEIPEELNEPSQVRVPSQTLQARFQALRADLTHADRQRRLAAARMLCAWGEVNHPEVHHYFLQQLRKGNLDDPIVVPELLTWMPWRTWRFNPQDENVLLRHWAKMLEGPPSGYWRLALNGLSWMGAVAGPAAPSLLMNMERMLWDESTNWSDPTMKFGSRSAFDPDEFGSVLDKIDPRWKRTPAGRVVLARLCERIQWKRQHGIKLEEWEYRLWRCGGWSTPEFQTWLVERFFRWKNDELRWDEFDYQDLHELSPEWVGSVEAQACWSRLEPEYPFLGPLPKSGVLNRFFLRLTLHHNGLTPAQKRDYLLKLIAAGRASLNHFQVLDDLDPAWPESPLVKGAIPLLEKKILGHVNEEDPIPNLDCWTILRRIGAEERAEFPLLMYLLAHYDEYRGYISDWGDKQFDVSEVELRRRLREINPDYLQSDLAKKHRNQALGDLVSGKESIRAYAFEKLDRLHYVEAGQDLFPELPSLLHQLARLKEAEVNGSTPVGRLLYQVAHSIREQKILDGPILLPNAEPAEKSKPSGTAR